MTYRERRLRKADRLREWADKRMDKSDRAFQAARTIADGIPLGQPILVGHHSEGRHRRDIARIDNNMRKGVESERMAQSMTSRADNIEAAADAAIYNDDPDAVERLTAKLASLEAERERIKVVNKLIRKSGFEAVRDQLTDIEQKELLSLAHHSNYHQPLTRGFPAYQLQNLGGTITRTRQRLAVLKGKPAPAPETAAGGATATERAGLKVIPTMTTPSRPGKQPRPVWNVIGSFGNHREMLIALGGSWYRGAFSFWEDPAASIEAALLEKETPCTPSL